MIPIRRAFEDKPSAMRARIGHVIRPLLLVGVPLLLVCVWVGSYFYSVGAAYMTHGNFDAHVPNRLYGINVNRGIIIFIKQIADVPDLSSPSPFQLATHDFNNQPAGFACDYGPAEPHFEERNETWPGMLGFYYYHSGDGTELSPYGGHFSFHAWMCPIAVVALPAMLPLALVIRRKFRQRKRNAPGFPVTPLK